MTNTGPCAECGENAHHKDGCRAWEVQLSPGPTKAADETLPLAQVPTRITKETWRVRWTACRDVQRLLQRALDVAADRLLENVSSGDGEGIVDDRRLDLTFRRLYHLALQGVSRLDGFLPGEVQAIRARTERISDRQAGHANIFREDLETLLLVRQGTAPTLRERAEDLRSGLVQEYASTKLVVRLTEGVEIRYWTDADPDSPGALVWSPNLHQAHDFSDSPEDAHRLTRYKSSRGIAQVVRVVTIFEHQEVIRP